MYPIAPGGAKLLLISPPDHEHREWRGTQPLGIAYLAGYLRQHGARADLLDGNWGDHPLPLDEIVAYALAGEYETVGISLLTATIPTARALSQRLKAQRPRLQIIWGGYHPTFAPYESLNDFPEIDIVVRGEGEATLLELLQAQQSGRPLAEVAGLGYREGKRIKLTPARPLLQNLDEIPFPARDLLPPVSSYPGFMDTVDQKPRIKASLISSRGCPFHCHFCSIITFYAASPGKSWRGRSVANVVDEMEQLARQGGVSHFEFQDDNFFVQPKRALEIAEALRARGVDFTFAFLTRADQIVKGEKYFPAFRQAGLRYVGAGLESGSQGSLDRLNKETTVEENSRALGILWGNDVAAQVDFIMFEPNTTIEDLEQNLDFIESHGLFGYFPPIILSTLALFPGTRSREEAEAAGIAFGSVHESLPYHFQNQDAAQVKVLLDQTMAIFGAAWYELVIDLQDELARREAELARANGQAASFLPLVRELKLEYSGLASLPYLLLKRLLRAGRQAGFQALEVTTLMRPTLYEFDLARTRVASVRARLSALTSP
ncbi:radical SAM protein [Candidatus Amarolinea dominans]|uniref:B12-binding domain-containing radical SAM protein n=1 Tax=Candidatus Amarolinea dominans TaxID=3140696 RepID=UPI0031363200|nr:cobalamin-dependent protein [Anaerolineae bacterium]